MKIDQKIESNRLEINYQYNSLSFAASEIHDIIYNTQKVLIHFEDFFWMDHLLL